MLLTAGPFVGTVELHLDSADGILLGSQVCEPTGDWMKYRQLETAITPVDGVHDLCLLFRGESEYIMNVDSFVFVRAEGSILFGDVNQDGEVSVADAVLLCKYITETEGTAITEDGLTAADMDEDDLLTVTDAKLILKLLVPPAPPAEPLKGDVNSDGTLSTEDAKLIRACIKALSDGGEITLTDEQLELADVNGDGQIDEKDASLLEKLISGESA
jgi:hypothetical protein